MDLQVSGSSAGFRKRVQDQDSHVPDSGLPGQCSGCSSHGDGPSKSRRSKKETVFHESRAGDTDRKIPRKHMFVAQDLDFL